MKQVQARVTIEGRSPVLWRQPAFITESRQLYLPRTYLFACITEAMGTGQKPFHIKEVRCLFDRFLPAGELSKDKTQPVYLHTRAVYQSGTKRPVLRYSVAASHGWSCSFTLLFDPDRLSPDDLRAILERAGQEVGIGDGRKMGFGRFTVERWEVSGTQRLWQ